MHNTVFFFLIIFFTYFYTEITYDPARLRMISRNTGAMFLVFALGEATALYIKNVLDRIVLRPQFSWRSSLCAKHRDAEPADFGFCVRRYFTAYHYRVALETVQEI